MRGQADLVDIVHAFQRRVLPAVDLEDHLTGPGEPGGVVAHGGGRDQGPVGGDARDLDQGRIQRTEEALQGHGRHLAEVHVEIVHLPPVDPFTGDGIGIVGQAELDAVGPGERAVQFGARGGAGPDLHLKGLASRMGRLDPGR